MTTSQRLLVLGVTLTLLSWLSAPTVWAGALLSQNNANSGGYSQPGAYTTPYSGGNYDSNYNGYGQSSYGNTPYSNAPANLPPLQGRVITAPAGTMLNATPTAAVSSETARVGDRFTASLGSDVSSGGGVVLPAGSQLEAQVVSVTKAGHAGRNGRLDVRFTTATLPTGQRVPISGRIQTKDGSGVIKGGSAAGSLGRTAVKTGIGAGLGAALGTALGPLSGGGVGRGAIYGTALGGGAGLATSAWQKGKDAVIDGSQPITIVLDQPVTVNAGAASSSGAYGQDSGGNYGAPANYNGGYYGN